MRDRLTDYTYVRMAGSKKIALRSSDRGSSSVCRAASQLASSIERQGRSEQGFDVSVAPVVLALVDNDHHLAGTNNVSIYTDLTKTLLAAYSTP